MNRNLFPDIELPLYDPSQPRTFDLVVVGSGPSGLAVADRVAQAGFQVGPQQGHSQAATKALQWGGP
jgi:pyruvate/2-oxoglutarate dehydrogenase complex dihydrolipoamide dehydrogenase (E3) component